MKFTPHFANQTTNNTEKEITTAFLDCIHINTEQRQFFIEEAIGYSKSKNNEHI